MHLTATTPDEEIDDPTDHPNVREDKNPLNSDDADETLYEIGFKGGTVEARFFRAIFVDRLDEDAYDMEEFIPPHGVFHLYGIPESAIDDVIETFNATVEDVEEVYIVGKVDGTEYRLTT